MLTMDDANDQNTKHVILNITDNTIVADSETPVCTEVTLQTFGQMSGIFRIGGTLAQIDRNTSCGLWVELF